ncbi:MAG: proline dehydrogenase family protein [Chitinophagales bacterium]|nr:proline dehydrogenase family protein [Chitinophagales bacterium]MDW8273624.1 proline dehydrogenase family protein [Chitinophagales bacterium]
MPNNLHKIFEDTETAFASKDDRALKEARLLFKLIGNPTLVNTGTKLADFALKLRLPITPLFRITVFDQFCGGETLEECSKTINELAKYRIKSMLNYGVELKETEEDFDKTVTNHLKTIAFAGKNRNADVVCIKITGFGRFGLFEKMQENATLSGSEKDELKRVKERFHTLCRAAQKQKVSLYVDAEESWIQDTLDKLTEEMMEQYNKELPIVFNTFQLYRWDRLEYLKQQIAKAAQHNYILGAKLVRGAYIEKENERAKKLGYRSPIHQNKKSVDADFKSAVDICLDNLNQVSICVATQSEQSCYDTIKKMEEKMIPFNHPFVCFSQLYGMGDNITFNLAKHGFNAYKYLPYGPVKDVIPYLIRRAQENTSVNGQMSRELKLIEKEIERRNDKKSAARKR